MVKLLHLVYLHSLFITKCTILILGFLEIRVQIYSEKLA